MVVTRRSLIAGMTALPVAGAAARAGRARRDADRDPRSGPAGIVKLQADLDERRSTPWWYEVAIYAVVGDAAPALLLRAEGCETYRMRAEPDGSYRSRGATVTAFKDPIDGRWVDDFDNPYTGRRNAVRPNVITDASILYPRDGSVPLPSAPPGQSAPTGWLRWIESGDRIGCLMERRATGAIQPVSETASLWTDRAGFFDPSTTRAEAVFSSSFASPWFGWMEMAGRPGHLLWHSTGRKLHTLDDLPAAFRARAERLAPGRLGKTSPGS